LFAVWYGLDRLIPDTLWLKTFKPIDCGSHFSIERTLRAQTPEIKLAPARYALLTLDETLARASLALKSATSSGDAADNQETATPTTALARRDNAPGSGS
jgi:hypothetical protein